MTPIDLMIHPGILLQSTTSGAAIETQPDLALAINDRRIIAVAPPQTLAAQYQPHQTITLPNHLVMPGLINASSHVLGIVSRGSTAPRDVFAAPVADSRGTTNKVRADSELFAAAQLAFTEMLLAGTTTCADMSPHSEAVARAAQATGINAQISVPVTEAMNSWTQTAQAGLDRALALHDTYARHSRIDIAFGLPNLAQIDRDVLVKTATYAEELGLPVQVLLHQTPAHILTIEDRHGCDGVQLLEQVGLLGPNLQLVHVNAIDDEAMALLHRYQVGLVRCPHPFAKQMRPWDWPSEAQPKGLGTGGYDLNYYGDLFRSIGNVGIGGIHAATQGGAKVLGLDDRIGSLKPGKLADIIALDMRVLDARFQADAVDLVLPQLLTHGRANQAVTHAWVAGKGLLQERQIAPITSADPH